jgi:preprotein translocase subunit SecD
MKFFMLTRPVLFLLLFSSSFILFSSCEKEKRKPNIELVVEVSMRDMLSALAFGKSHEAYFQRAVSKADSVYRIYPDSSYLNIFIPILKIENPAPLSETFAIAKFVGDSDLKIIQFLSTSRDLTVERAMKVIEKRLNTDSSEVTLIHRINRTSRIQIQMYNGDWNSISRMISINAQVYFCEVLPTKDIAVIFNRVDAAVMSNDTLKMRFNDKDKEFSILRSLISSGNNNLMYEFADTARINSLLSHPALGSVLPSEVSYYWVSRKGATNAELLFMYNRNADQSHWISGEVIEKTKVTLDERNDPIIELEMDGNGTQYWKEITKRLSSDLEEKGRIAVLVDQKCYMAPTVMDEIQNGHMDISGNMTMKDAQELNSFIESGALPSRCYIVD